MDALIRGFVEQPCQTFDQFFTKQISKSLFTDRPPFGVGMDLISLNIQRGRDHGLPGWLPLLNYTKQINLYMYVPCGSFETFR